MSITLTKHQMFRNLRGLMAVVLGGMLWLITAGNAQAQQCNASGFGISFGTVSTSANTDVTGSLPYQCQANASNTYYKVCFFMPGGSDADISGINPRRMKDYNGHYINYNVYSDAARTQVIGPPPTGAGYTVYTWDFMVLGGWSSPSRTLPVYGRVPAIPVGTSAGNYQAQMGGIVLQYAWSNSTTPADCFQTAGGGGGSANVGYSGSTATVSNSCSIAISQTTNLDFGTYSSLATNHDSTSTISLACPANTSWRVGLNNGINASAAQRRMKSPAGNFINYELYRDNNRIQRWGNDTTGGSDTVNGSGSSQANPTVLTVYGRTPVQAIAPAGTYTDTITVTLTY